MVEFDMDAIPSTIRMAAASLGSAGTWGSQDQLVLCDDARIRLLLMLALLDWTRRSGKYCHVRGDVCIMPSGKVLFGGKPPDGVYRVVNLNHLAKREDDRELEAKGVGDGEAE